MSPQRRRGIIPYPFLRTLNVLWGKLDLSAIDKMDFTDDEVEELSLKIGDLLVCEGGEVGRTAVWNGYMDICLHQNHIHRLRRITDNVIPEFYMYWMQAAFKVFKLYGGQASETTIPNLSIGRLRSFLVPFPPLEIQRHIAAKLQELMNDIESARNACEKQLEAAKALPSAYLREVFESPEAKKWERKQIREYLTQNKYKKVEGILQKYYKKSANYPIIDQGQKLICGYTDEVKSLYKGELPVIIFGDHTRIFKYIDFPFAIGADGTKIIRPNNEIFSPRFFYFALLSLEIRDLGYSRHYKLLKEMSIPVPPLETQRRIASQLKEKMDCVDKLRIEIEKQLEIINSLPQAILKKAFRGKI